MGGEEFVIFLPHTNIDGAREAAERIRKAIEETAIEASDNVEQKITLPKITISVGCASTKDLANLENIEEEKALDQLVRMADRALYGAKNAGRNRVMAFDEIGQGAGKQ